MWVAVDGNLLLQTKLKNGIEHVKTDERSLRTIYRAMSNHQDLTEYFSLRVVDKTCISQRLELTMTESAPHCASSTILANEHFFHH